MISEIFTLYYKNGEMQKYIYTECWHVFSDTFICIFRKRHKELFKMTLAVIHPLLNRVDIECEAIDINK